MARHIPKSLVYLPNWYMKVIKPGIPVRDNVAVFEVPKAMGKFDIKNYLESIYDLKVLGVNTINVLGKTTNAYSKKMRTVKPHKKAYVTLSVPFKYPLQLSGEEEDNLKPKPKENKLSTRKSDDSAE